MRGTIFLNSFADAMQPVSVLSARDEKRDAQWHPLINLYMRKITCAFLHTATLLLYLHQSIF
jgi:hypothetical protein